MGVEGEARGMQLLMSQRERDRLKVIHEVASGEGGAARLTQARAGELLGLSERQVRRLVKRYRQQGDAGLIHRSRGRPSNRRLPTKLRAQAMKRMRKAYQGFGPTLAAEKLAERDGLVVSRETLRRWMIEEAIWKPRRRRAQHRQRRLRKECCGEMVQMDTSVHEWFEGRGESAVLVNMIDDATGRVFMRFFPGDTRAANMTLLRDYIRQHGRPLALYADKASHFMTTRSSTLEEQLEGRDSETQIGRALRELEIQYIAAHSPQAKGRVERSFGTLQDRLVKELRLQRIATIEAANAFVEQVFMPHYNQRFAQPPANPVDLHRPLNGHDLDAIFSHQQPRAVANDYTIRHRNNHYQIQKSSIRAGLRRDQVLVEERLDGTLKLRWRGKYLAYKLVHQTPPSTRSKPRTAAPPVGLRPPSGTAVTTQVLTTTPPLDAAKQRTPKPDHPWRKPYKRKPQNRTSLPCRKPDTSTLP